MRKYEIPIQYMVYNTITVEAEDLQAAMDKAWESDDWETGGEISTDSFEVQEDVISQINDDEVKKECEAHGFYIW